MNALTNKIDELFAAWDKPDSPGCALGVVQDGKLVYKNAYGMADLERNVPLSPQSLFDIASTSKQFTAMCIALLAEQGKLSLDDDIRKHVPEMPEYEHTITLRHLVHHTSGIRDYLELMDLAGMRFENDYYEEEMIALIARQKELNFKPGDEYLYSNSGYFLLGEIVKRVSGKPLGDFVREQVFEPLGMHNTRLYDDFKAIVPNRAIGYAPREEGGYSTELYMFDLVGDGGVLTSVEDLFLWDQNFYENKLGEGGQDLIEQMHTTMSLNDGKELDYAFGLGVGEYRGLPMVDHAGGWAGYSSEMIRFPEQQFSVICLSNLATFNASGLAQRVADVYLADQFEQEPVETGVESDYVLTASELEAKTGAFRNPKTGRVVKLRLQDGKLMVHYPAGLVFQITPTEPDQFQSLDAPDDITFTFEITDDAPSALHEETQGQDPITFEAFEPTVPDPAELNAYTGEYESDELEVTCRLILRDGQLFRKFRRNPNASPLVPTVEHEFSVGEAIFEFVRDDEVQVSGFNARAGRVKNVWFAKKASGPSAGE